MRRLILLLGVVGALASCTSSEPVHDLNALPDHFPEIPVPADNPLTPEKIELGRHLFYDFRLSINHRRSCGICHEQIKGFTDGFVQPVGTFENLLPHNTPTLTNVAWRESLTWLPRGLAHLEEQMLIPLLADDPAEMGMGGQESVLLERLRALDVYQELFPEAFSDQEDPFTLHNITLAIGAFQRTIISAWAPYDQYLVGDDDAMSDSAKRGMALFLGSKMQCFRCHGGPQFDSPTDADGAVSSTHGYFNTGLYDLDGEGAYPERARGVIEVTGRAEDMGKFRTPTLRNLLATGPYTHDGTVPTLDYQLDIYARGGRYIDVGPTRGDGKDNPLKDPRVNGFSMTDDEKSDLLAFLAALTEPEFLVNPDIADPFGVTTSESNGLEPTSSP